VFSEHMTKNRASVLDVLFPRRRGKRARGSLQLCVECGAWVHDRGREHDTLCFAIRDNAALIRDGLILAVTGPTARGNAAAPWPVNGNLGRGEKSGYAVRSARVEFHFTAQYAESRPPGNRTNFDENAAFVERLRALGYSDGEIALSLWSYYGR